METIWLTKLLLAHMLTDFLFQPKAWVDHRMKNHFSSPFLYLHSLITAIVAWIFIGWSYWLVALIIFITHTLIDGWKSYSKPHVKFFLIDQLMHILVILACWWFTFFNYNDFLIKWRELSTNVSLLLYITAFIFVTFPAASFIGQLTTKWRIKLGKEKAEDLENAGKWIGIIERCIILVMVFLGKYEAIGIIIAAKGIIRFGDNDRSEQKTEYLLIGTLISFSIAILAGLVVLNIKNPPL